MDERPVYDWKKELEILKIMLQDECDRHKCRLQEINEQAKKVIELGGKDAQEAWNEILEEFSVIGEKIGWMKWRYVYIAIALVIFGLILHYVFGV